jgi:nucleotide-binding universal stress UspA family protein
MKTDKILIVADDSESSIKVIEYGFNLARDLSAKVILLSVVDPIYSLGNPDAGVFPDDALMVSKAGAVAFLNAMKENYGAGIDVELLTPVGDVQPVVCETAMQQGADLIVTGTHGRTGLAFLFKGSVAGSIIHHSPVPVCVVPIGK